MTEFSIVRLQTLPTDLMDELVAESQTAGFRFLRRLVDDWTKGSNRFDQEGEALFVAFSGRRVIGVCGLNRDPYTDRPEIGRVRRLYVLSGFRQQGIGRQLLMTVVTAARDHYRLLRLRTENESAGRLYESLGFRVCTGIADCTHVLELTAVSA